MLRELKTYTVKEAAEIVHADPETIRRYIRGKRLPATKIGNGWRVSQENLQKLIDGEL